MDEDEDVGILEYLSIAVPAGIAALIAVYTATAWAFIRIGVQ